MNNFLVGGVERLTYDIISRLDKDKFDISIITVLGSGPLIEQFASLGISIYFVGPIYQYNPNISCKILWFMAYPVILLQTWLKLLRIQPEIVTTSLFHADIIGILAGRLAGVKRLILVQHDTKKISWFRKITKQYFGVGLATHIVAVSDSVKCFLTNYFHAVPEKISVIPNGIDLSKFANVSTQSIRVHQPVIGFLGRLETIKGIQYFVSAVELLKTNYQLVPSVLIFGTGSLESKLKEYTSTHQLQNISWQGKVSSPETALSKVDILVVPSENEGFGLVLLEGLTAGRVVVASDLPVFKEIVNGNDIVKFFAATKSDHLAQILVGLLGDPALMMQYQINAKEWLQRKGEIFDLQNTVKQYQELLIG